MSDKRIRRIRFERRSALPVSAACVIASGVREALAPLFGSGFRVRLFPPALPSAHAWLAIVRDARLFTVRGPSGEAVIVLRRRDAATLAAAAFGEAAPDERALSALEETALDRLVRLIAVQLAPVCGQGSIAVERCSDARELVTYFELQCDAPVCVRIGIGLRRDPEPPAPVAAQTADISTIHLRLAVQIDAGTLPAAALVSLQPGDLVPFPPGALRGRLSAAGRALGFGECGVSGNRYAFSLTSMSQGS